jgi:Cu-Zn family superoxide dismutase
MIQVACRWLLPLLVFLLPLAACEREKAKTPAAPAEKAEAEIGQSAQAVAELKPTEGNNVTGKVTFISQNGALRVVADIEGLAPGKHGFHIHEIGDCSAPDASSAGGHFNPGKAPHGAPENPPAQRHAGDLGNLEANADGKAHYEMLDQVLALGGPNSIVGKSVIVHAQPDDLSTQPVGNAGPRLACGVIQAGE